MTEQDPVQRLQDLILLRVSELGDSSGPMSAREVARRSEGLVSYETVRNLMRGMRHTGRISDRVAEGLSRALQIPVVRVYEAAGVPAPGERWQWPHRFDRLNPAQRALVEEVAAAILEAETRGTRRNS